MGRRKGRRSIRLGLYILSQSADDILFCKSSQKWKRFVHECATVRQSATAMNLGPRETVERLAYSLSRPFISNESDVCDSSWGFDEATATTQPLDAIESEESSTLSAATASSEEEEAQTIQSSRAITPQHAYQTYRMEVQTSDDNLDSLFYDPNDSVDTDEILMDLSFWD